MKYNYIFIDEEQFFEDIDLVNKLVNEEGKNIYLD